MKSLIKFIFLCASVFHVIFLCGCSNQHDTEKPNDFRGNSIQTSTILDQGASLEDQLIDVIKHPNGIGVVETEAIVKRLLAQGVNVSAIDEATITVAIEFFNQGTITISPASAMTWTEDEQEENYAARRSILWHLIDAGTYFNDCDDEWLVRQIVKSGNILFVELLVKKGVDLTEYKNILLDAANSGNEAVFKLVFSLIPTVNCQNEDGNSVLMEAAVSHYDYDVPRSEAIIKFLLEHDADVNHRNKYGDSALTFAVECAHENIVRLLLQGGIDLGKEPKTLFHKAVIGKNKKVIKLLLDKGLSVNERDENGETPLHWAAGSRSFKWSQWADPAMIKFLLKNGAEINAQDKYGNTPLISHILNLFHEEDVCFDTILTLAHFGADVSIKNNSGKTAKDYLTNDPDKIGRLNVFKSHDILDHPKKNAHLAYAPTFSSMIKSDGYQRCRKCNPCCHYMRRNDNHLYIFFKQDLSDKLVITREIFKADNNVSIYFPRFSEMKDKEAENKLNEKLKKTFTNMKLAQQSKISEKDREQYYGCDFDLWQINNLIIIMRREFTIFDEAKVGQDKQKSFFIDATTGKFYQAHDLFKKDADVADVISRLIQSSNCSPMHNLFDKKFPLKNNFIITHEGLEIYLDSNNASHYGQRVFKIKHEDIDAIIEKNNDFYKSFAKAWLE
ncbi:MAG: ankyrin repeat domain-containing protein [Candidatus Babeliales bacterium]|jgi:ankyrin repeat protein